MKKSKQILKRAAGALLVLLFLVALVPDGAWATVDYWYSTTDWGDWTSVPCAVYQCPVCSFGIRIINEDPEEFWDEPDISLFDEYFCGECGLCWECATEHAHCHECGDCVYGGTEGEDYCAECKKCRSCWTEDEHCPNCHRHRTERCDQCSWNMCYDCHDEHEAWCDYCGSCLYKAYEDDTWCPSGNHHCQDCCVICEDCDGCFATASHEWDPDEFCGICGLCVDCGIEDEQHCPSCRVCFDIEPRCEDEESEVCIDCCIEQGNHCPECGKHIGTDGEWCPTDPEVHCLECAEASGICPGCGECFSCADLEQCEDCGMCLDCCLMLSESYGCDCGLCVESAEFEDAEHCCERCGQAFSCVEEFCEDCGLCMDCCLATSEDAGCVCGICVANSDFEDDGEHMCANCGGFTCVNGEICIYCGYCEECCLEASEDAGCVCGLCVEDSAFDDPDHLCANCETALSCATEFCGDCGWCEDCCKYETLQYGCPHEICVRSSAWTEHYCEDCGRCKEDCDCGQDCCAVTEYSYERSVARVLGSIISQPRNVGAYVSDGSNDDYLHTNRISFDVYAFGDPNELYYQWYRKDGPEGKPEKLIDEVAGDEEYWGRNDAITKGATAQTLTTYVPADACVKDYYYYCEITDRNGNILSTSREAKLRGRHKFAWVQTEGGHIYRCVGCGVLGKFADEVREHEFTERQILVYPTETEQGLLGNRCQVCGYSEGEVIAPLGKHDRHEFRYYCNSREHWCECFCGKKINARSEHSWGDWILDEPATEKSRGSKHRVCLVCHYRQDAKIEKKLHAHGSFYSGDESDHSFHKINTRQHGRICDDPECGQYYDIEPHTFDQWLITLYPGWESEGSMERVCTGCGYTQTKKIPKLSSELGSKRIIVVEHGTSTRTATTCSGNDKPVLTAEERPGYIFDNWLCEFSWLAPGEEKRHFINVPVMTPVQASYAGRTDVIQVDDPNAEVMTILKLPPDFNDLLPYAVDYNVAAKGECYFDFTPQYTHLPLRVAILPEDSCRNDDRVIILPGEGYDVKTGTVKKGKLGTHLYLEELETEEEGAGFTYEYILHMTGYEGGPIEILSPDPDAQLNCKVLVSIEDRESVIRSMAGADYGLSFHCFNGGEVTVTSENGGKLTIDVEGGRTFDVRGIDVEDEIGRTSVFLNNANVEIVSTNLRKPVAGVDASAVGIYAGDVRIWGGSLSIEAHAPRLNNALAAVGIDAKASIDIDSPILHIDVTDVDVGAGGTGAGLNAKSVVLSMEGAVSLSYWYDNEDEEGEGQKKRGGNGDDAYSAGVFIDYPETGFAVKLPKEDPAGMAAITTYGENEQGSRSYTHRLGYTVQIDYDPDKLTLSPVGKVYVDEQGRFCVPAGGALEFVAAAAPGYRGNNIGLYRDGQTYILPTIDEDENRRYRIEHVTECMVLQLDSVQPVEPFASDPLPSTQTVMGGGLGTAAVTWEMNAYEVHKLYRKNGGSQSANGVLERHEEGETLQTDTAYSAGVWLQSYNSTTDRWNNRPELGTFEAKMHSFAEFTETRQYSRPGTTTRYRLALLFDGLQYYSEPFEVIWTADEAEVSARIASAVELYMTDAWNSNGAATIYDGCDSGTWMRLDARCSDIYYDIQSGLYVNSFDRTKKQPTADDGYIRFAHFDASKGVLTLDAGQSGYWNSDYDIEYWYDTTNVVLHEIRTAEDSHGDLTVYAAGDFTIDQDTSTVGWIDQWGNGKLVHFADNAAILNETGSVILTGAPKAELIIQAYGPYDMVREQRPDGSYFYTGERISAVRASGDVRADGPFVLRIIADCDKDWDPTPGYYGCAVGLDAQGDIRIGGETNLVIDVGTNGSNPAGSAQGMYAAGHIRMEDDCSVDVWTYGVESQSLYCNNRAGIWAEKTVTVDEHASFSVYCFGEEYYAVYAGECAYFCSDRAARISAVPTDDIYSQAICAPRTVVNGFQSFTWKDPDSPSPVSGEMDLGKTNTYVYYVTEPDWFDGSRSLTVMDGMPRRLELITQGLSADETRIEITRNGDTVEVFGKEFEVCPGDTVTVHPPVGLPGCTFDHWGWPRYWPDDVKELPGGAISFTMPTWDVAPLAIFDTSVVSGFCFALDAGDLAMTAGHRIGKADVDFRVEIPADFEAGTRLEGYAVLECNYENEEGELVWADRDTEPANRYSYLSHDEVVYDKAKGIASFNVSETLYLADIIPTEQTPGEWVRIYESADHSYRLRIMLYTVEEIDGRDRYVEWCTMTTNPFELSWNKPFEADVDGEGRNPEIFIPAGDVGTSYSIDFSKYVSGGSGSYHFNLLPAVQPLPMEFMLNEDRGTFCFFHTENSLGMNYADNIMQVTDKLTGEMALIHFDVIPTLNTQMYDTYVGGVHVSEYNREDVLGDGRVSYTPAEGGEPARLTLRGATLSAGFCGRQDPAVYGKDAFAAIFTREDLEIIAEGSNVIVLDEFSDAPENAYVVGSLIAGIYGFGANVTLSGSGELIVKSRHGFWLAEDSGHNGGGLILNGGSLTTKVDNGNACRSFTYAGGRFCGFSAQNSEKALLNGLSFAGGTQEKTLLLLSAEPDGKNAQPGTPEMLASQQPGDLFRYVLIQPANRLAEEPEMLAGVNGETGELSVGVNKSVKGVSTMKAIVAVYDKATGRFQEMWMGDVNPIDPLTGTGLIYDEAKRYRIMVLDGDVWRPLADSEDV